MKRIFTILVCLLLVWGTSYATPRDESTALNIASEYFSQNTQLRKLPSKKSQTLTCAWTATQTDGHSAFYVFNRGTDDGFVIVSAEDRTRTILAYSEDGHFNQNSIPENMRAWLSIYQNEISQIAKEPTSVLYSDPYKNSYVPVSPICSTKWGQGSPYNLYCPQKGEERCVTGCVATAAAQIMKVHNYPTQGSGSHSYDWAKSEQETVTLSADYGNTTYQWSMMRNSYPSSATEEQRDAVAKLIYHCGVSCNMNYGLNAEGGSGANTALMLSAMVNYFGYDAAIQPICKDYMQEDSFIDSIYVDLQAGCPVLFSARTINNESHAFVCDGIDANGFIHINWGWTGTNDAYYRVSALNPQNQGTGGSAGNNAYTEHVMAYTHIQPNIGGSLRFSFAADTITPSDHQGNTHKRFARNERVYLHMTKMENQSISTLNISPVILLYKEGSLFNAYANDNEILTMSPGSYLYDYMEGADFSSLPIGQYQLKPAIRVQGQDVVDIPVWTKGLAESRFLISVTNDSIFIGNIESVKQNECGNNLVWSLDTITGTLTINGFGAMYNFATASAPWYDYAESIVTIDLPDDITTIGENAFAGCSNLKSIHIPDGIVSIGNHAFLGCSALISITCDAIAPPKVEGAGVFNNVNKLIPVYVPNRSVEFYQAANYWNEFINIMTIESCTIASGYCGAGIDSTNLSWSISCDSVLTISGSGEMAYTAPWQEYKMYIKAVIIQNGVTNIDAFSGCTSLTSVEIPNSVTSIGGGAFSGCTSLTSVEIPNSVTSIEGWAFYDCSSLSSITIPNSVTSIEERVFYNCTSLTSVEIPNSVTSIGELAFFHCYGLTSVEIPNSVTNIGHHAFYMCTGLTSVTIPNSVTNIGSSAFSDCNSLTSVIIPNGVTSIGNYMFSSCYRLVSVEIPNSVTNIEEHAFWGCRSLTSVTIPNSVTNIGSGAFYGCSSLISAIIPNSVTNIGSGAFSDCTSLTSFNVMVDNLNYCSIDGALFNKDTTTLIQYPEGKEGEYTIPNSVTSIGEYAFYCCQNLTSVTIPESVTTIGNYAFAKYSNQLKKIICFCTNPPILGENVFNVFNGYAPFFVPSVSVNLYKEAYNIPYIFPIEEDPNEPCVIASGYCGAEGDSTNLTWQLSCDRVLEISGNGKMAKYTTIKRAPWYPNKVNFHIETIIVGDGVENVGDYAFDGTSVDSIYLGANVMDIGQQRFYGCGRLTNITVSENNSVYSSIDGVLYNKDKTTLVQYPIGRTGNEYTIPEGVITIGYNAFYQCHNITSVIIPNSTKTIGGWAFASSGIMSITLPDSLQRIESSAFRASSLESLYIPAGTTYFGTQVFNSCRGLTSISVDENNPKYDSRNNCNAIINTNTNTLIFGCVNTIIPNTVVKIESSAFDGQDKLTSITIPSNVANIGDYAFGSCNGLMSIICEAVNPPSTSRLIGSTRSYVFNNVDKSKIILYVPEESIELYQEAPEWNEFPNILPIPDNMAVDQPVNPGFYHVSLYVNDEDMGTVNGEGSFPQGTEVVITAIPAIGHHFLKWSDDCIAAERTISLTVDTALTAYFEPNVYYVTFANYNGRILQMTLETYGTMPEYVGKSPIRPTVDKYEYSFVGWAPSITPVTDDIIYTALYDSVLCYTILTLDTIGADISNRWFAFAVPFEVPVETGITKEGSNTPTLYGSSYVIDEYDGALRASTQNGWKRVAATDTLRPGKMYMFASNSARVWRLTSISPAIMYQQDNIAVQAYPSSIGEHHAGWNGIANSQFAEKNVALDGVQYATIYDNTYGVYSTVLLNEWTCPSVTPFFVQTPADGTVHFSIEKNLAPNFAPMRVQFSAEPSVSYTLELTDAVSDYTDKAYVTTNTEKEDRYIIGKDLAKIQVKNPSVPQVWIEAYNTHLVAYEVPYTDDNICVHIGLFAPQEGYYTLAINDVPQDANIYLTQNGQNIWNLSQSSYALNLVEGENNEYGLSINKMPTAIDEMRIENENGECTKVFINGQIYILRGEKVYTVTGQEVE